MFLKLPLTQNQPIIKELAEGFLEQLDTKLNSNEFKECLGINKKTKYTYQSIVRAPVGEDGELNPNKHKYMKIKLLTEYPSNVIRTTVVEQNDDSNRLIKEDTQTIKEIEKYFRLGTNLRCIIAPVKLWIHQNNANEATYGLTFKLIKVLIKVPLGKSLTNQNVENEIDFLDSDSD
jgi:hypothetical protein